jgi:hypothetical protein
MKSTIKTLVVTMVLGTASVAAGAELTSMPVSPAEQSDAHHATAATAVGSLYALNPLNAETLAAQEMTDQELKAVEGRAIFQVYSIGVGWGTVVLEVYQDSSGQTTTMYMK